MTKDFKLIGIATTTSNQENITENTVGKLWQKFITENCFEKIPNKIATDLFAIYTDYESNHTGNYTTIIGTEVSTLEEIPTGFVGRKFQGANFLTFTAKGEMPTAVAEKWQEIWAKDADLKRKYDYDFEVYGAKSNLGADSEVEIYIGVE